MGHDLLEVQIVLENQFQGAVLLRLISTNTKLWGKFWPTSRWLRKQEFSLVYLSCQCTLSSVFEDVGIQKRTKHTPKSVSLHQPLKCPDLCFVACKMTDSVRNSSPVTHPSMKCLAISLELRKQPYPFKDECNVPLRFLVIFTRNATGLV